jgi:hypothetical protein
MHHIEGQRKSIGFAAVLAAIGLFASVLMLLFALHFRLAPGPSDEPDIAIGMSSVLMSPLFITCCVLGFQHGIAIRSRLLLWAPALLSMLSVIVVSVGIVARP